MLPGRRLVIAGRRGGLVVFPGGGGGVIMFVFHTASCHGKHDPDCQKDEGNDTQNSFHDPLSPFFCLIYPLRGIFNTYLLELYSLFGQIPVFFLILIFWNSIPYSGRFLFP